MQASAHRTPDEPRLETTRPRWIIVVARDQAAGAGRLQREYRDAPWVEVLVDRRVLDRRSEARLVESDRRMADRRPGPDDPRVPPYRLCYRRPGFEVYEAMSPGSTACPACGLRLWFDLPRFAEPPGRLRLSVTHEDTVPGHSRHVVDLESFTTTGRPLVATRTAARPGVERAGEP